MRLVDLWTILWVSQVLVTVHATQSVAKGSNGRSISCSRRSFDVQFANLLDEIDDHYLELGIQLRRNLARNRSLRTKRTARSLSKTKNVRTLAVVPSTSRQVAKPIEKRTVTKTSHHKANKQEVKAGKSSSLPQLMRAEHIILYILAIAAYTMPQSILSGASSYTAVTSCSAGVLSLAFATYAIFVAKYSWMTCVVPVAASLFFAWRLKQLQIPVVRIFYLLPSLLLLLWTNSQRADSKKGVVM